MTIQFNAAYVIQVIACLLMCFSWGVKMDFEERTRKVFNVLIWVCIATIWIVSPFR